MKIRKRWDFVITGLFLDAIYAYQEIQGVDVYSLQLTGTVFERIGL